MPSCSNSIPLTLYCDVESFFPEEVSVSWLQNDTVLPEPSTTEQNPDGTFRTRRYYTLSPEQREQGGKVECAVNQPGVVHRVSGSEYLEKLDPQGKNLNIWLNNVWELQKQSNNRSGCLRSTYRCATFRNTCTIVCNLYILFLTLCLHYLSQFLTLFHLRWISGVD